MKYTTGYCVDKYKNMRRLFLKEYESKMGEKLIDDVRDIVEMCFLNFFISSIG